MQPDSVLVISFHTRRHVFAGWNTWMLRRNKCGNHSGDIGWRSTRLQMIHGIADSGPLNRMRWTVFLRTWMVFWNGRKAPICTQWAAKHRLVVRPSILGAVR